MAEAIPIIDLSAPDAEAAAALGAACRGSGFFLAAGHGVPDDVVTSMFDQIRSLFDLPIADKMTLLQGDTKEGYYIGREVPADSPEAQLPLHGPNLWPPEKLLPGFRATAEAYFSAVTALCHRLLRLLAISLNLQPDHFNPFFDPPMVFLRPLHYSAEVSRPGDGVFGAGAHSDYGMLTVLATDGQPGLQVHVGGAWVDVPAAPRCFVCNLGDMLERWTNGLYKSTLHRVVSTTGRDRYSIPFFFEPNFNAVVEALPCCVTADRPAAYPPTTAGRHLLDKYAATHAGYGHGEAAAATAAAGVPGAAGAV